jgi:hypothetical protein
MLIDLLGMPSMNLAKHALISQRAFPWKNKSKLKIFDQ